VLGPVCTNLGFRYSHFFSCKTISFKKLKYNNLQLMKMLVTELEDMGNLNKIFGFFQKED
jgi:hypothetical protein